MRPATSPRSSRDVIFLAGSCLWGARRQHYRYSLHIRRVAERDCSHSAPLRTARESFPSSSSSLSNAPCGTRWCHIQRLALPSLVVTRCTASALPLNEWVRRCCKARTLPHRPACTAFTIRAWSLRTVRWTAAQSMVCQGTGAGESAPVSVATAVLCFLSVRGWASCLVTKDQMDVCPLARGVMLRGAQPLSIPLQDGLRFFHPPTPARLSACLAARFPSRETYGVAMFRLSHNEWGRRALSTGSVGCP